jgi:hypothetical protein
LDSLFTFFTSNRKKNEPNERLEVLGGERKRIKVLTDFFTVGKPREVEKKIVG